MDLISSAWLAICAAGLAVGAALGLGISVLLVRRRRPDARSVAWRSSLAFVSASVAVVALAWLVIAPPKVFFADRAVLLTAVGCCVAGMVGVAFPRAAGIPLALAGLTALAAISATADAYHPEVSGRAIASFVPHEVGESFARGDLTVPDRNAIPVLQTLALPAPRAALEVERLELGGPFGALFGARRYRLTRFVGADGATAFAFPARAAPLDALRAMDGAVSLPWISVRRSKGDVVRFQALGAVSYFFGADGTVVASGP